MTHIHYNIYSGVEIRGGSILVSILHISRRVEAELHFHVDRQHNSVEDALALHFLTQQCLFPMCGTRIVVISRWDDRLTLLKSAHLEQGSRVT